MQIHYVRCTADTYMRESYGTASFVICDADFDR